VGLKLDFEPVREIPDCLVVRLGGALEVNGAADFWKQASERTGPETRFVLVDLSRLNILTSAGVGMFVRLLVRLQDLGGALAIFGCSDKIREVFTIVMLEDALRVCATEAQARAALSKLAKG
jgi:anti-anti-sigma factor